MITTLTVYIFYSNDTLITSHGIHTSGMEPTTNLTEELLTLKWQQRNLHGPSLKLRCLESLPKVRFLWPHDC